MGFFYHSGRYFMMLANTFSRPEKRKILIKNFFNEVNKLGIDSMGLVSIISFFMGLVITIQVAYQIGAWMPKYVVGYTARESLILEFCPTIVSLILAGKVGSNIASELGTMRVTEQIDAIEIMGINSKSLLIRPKILSLIFFNPIITIYSIFLGLFGGWFICATTGLATTSDFILGIRAFFSPFSVTYALIKSAFFAFIITSLPAYHGYYAHGGAIEVGKASTKGVVQSSIAILVVNYLLTQILLA